MGRSFLAACDVLLAVSLVGCTSRLPQPMVSPSTSPASAVPLGSPTALPAQHLPVSYGGSPHAPFLPWQLVKVDDAAARVLIAASNLDCVSPRSVHVQESPTRVIITVEGRRVAEPCTAEKITLFTWVPLRQPVHGRAIAHGPAR